MMDAVCVTMLMHSFFRVEYCKIRHTQLPRCSMTALGGLARRGLPSCIAPRALCGLPDNSENEEYSFLEESQANVFYYLRQSCEKGCCKRELERTLKLNYRRGGNHMRIPFDIIQARPIQPIGCRYLYFACLRGNLDH
jgi:hypothetical protein